MASVPGALTCSVATALLGLATGALVAAVLPGCGADGASATTDGGPKGDVGDPVFGEAGVDGGPACGGCSADLHDVIGCDGRVVQTCPGDQGCFAGRCVPACEAASGYKSSVGCDYFAVPGTRVSPKQTCFAAFVMNTWGSPVKVAVERGGTPYKGAGYLPQGSGLDLSYVPLDDDTVPTGGAAIFFLSVDDGACPMPAAAAGGSTTQSRVTSKFDAWHLEASAPVVVSTIMPYGGGSSAIPGATLLLPTSAWDDNYVATTAFDDPTHAGGDGNPWVAFVAKDDGTEITLVPTKAIAGGAGVDPSPANVAKTYALGRGQVLRLNQLADLSGTVAKSNKPIGSFGGHDCTFLGDGKDPFIPGACDGMHTQIPPVRALGSEYAAVRYRNRWANFEETPPWRFVGAVDGTTLTFDPPQQGAPTVLARGQVVELPSAGQFVVKSQDAEHPFFFGAHMTGAGINKNAQSTPEGFAGDPEFLTVVPPAQFLSKYVFFTDPTYPETELLFVRTKGEKGAFADVTLDCKGTLEGWTPLGGGTQPAYEYVRVPIATGNFQKVGACDNGRHEASSEAPFGLTVWGWGTAAAGPMVFPNATANPRYSQNASYAYPAGAGARPINTVVVPTQPR